MLSIFRRFLRPYYFVLGLLVFLYMIPGVLLGIRPLVLAPALGTVISGNMVPARRFVDLSLDNIGPTILNWIGASQNDMAATFFWSALLYILLTIGIAGINTIANLVSISIRMDLLEDMINDLHRHLMQLPLVYFVRRKSSKLVSRFTQDLVVSSRSMETVVRGCVQSLVQAVIFLMILLKTDVLLSLQVLAIGMIHLLVTRVMGDWVKQSAIKYYDSIAQLTSALHESFMGVRILKTFAAEPYESLRINQVARTMRKDLHRFLATRYVEDPIRLLTDGFVAAAVIYLSYNAIDDKRLGMTGIALFFYLAGQFITPLSHLSKELLSAYSVYGSLQRLMEIFETKSDLRDGPLHDVTFQQKIELEDVHFAYQADRPAIGGVTICIQKNMTLALVGPSGSGKSTLLDLVLRLYDPNRGVVRLDGRDIREFKQSCYRKLFGVVSQESLLFNGTILENIVLGRPLDRAALDRACNIANIHDFISTLTKGYETTVGDRGIQLSGGQRQRICIARALYGNPEILVLDEATSSLDSESEREVQMAIEKALQNVTGIVVAHRLSTVINADMIAVINEGKVEAVGTHDDLLQNCSTYRRLYDIQFSNGHSGQVWESENGEDEQVTRGLTLDEPPQENKLGALKM